MIFFNAYKNIFILFKKTILTILFFKMTFMITFTSSALGSVRTFSISFRSSKPLSLLDSTAFEPDNPVSEEVHHE
jgi:hypothetical protein